MLMRQRRLSVVGPRFYKPKEAQAYRILAYFLIVCIVCFGPILGVIAAGIEFGAYTSPLAEKGERIRVTASYVRSHIAFVMAEECQMAWRIDHLHLIQHCQTWHPTSLA